MGETAKSGELVVVAVEAAEVTVTAGVIAEMIAAAEVVEAAMDVTAQYGWTNMDPQPARIIV